MKDLVHKDLPWCSVDRQYRAIPKEVSCLFVAYLPFPRELVPSPDLIRCVYRFQGGRNGGQEKRGEGEKEDGYRKQSALVGFGSGPRLQGSITPYPYHVMYKVTPTQPNMWAPTLTGQ